MPGPRPPKPGTKRFRQLEARRARDLEAYLKLQRKVERLPADDPLRATFLESLGKVLPGLQDAMFYQAQEAARDCLARGFDLPAWVRRAFRREERALVASRKASHELNGRAAGSPERSSAEVRQVRAFGDQPSRRKRKLL